jgi:hypothetical protein
MTADHRAPSGVKPTGGELGSAAAPSGLGRAPLLVLMLGGATLTSKECGQCRTAQQRHTQADGFTAPMSITSTTRPGAAGHGNQPQPPNGCGSWRAAAATPRTRRALLVGVTPTSKEAG